MTPKLSMSRRPHVDPASVPSGIVMTPLGQFVAVLWNGKNESGILPIGDRVLILPDGYADKIGSIIVDDKQQGDKSKAAETGVLVAIGDGAWTWNSDRTRPFSGTLPQVGQRVWFERYAGSEQHGDDGRLYRLMDDKCVGGLRVNGVIETKPARRKPRLVKSA